MIELSIVDIADALGGTVVGTADSSVSGTVHTDSRLVKPGDIFFALVGETTDGHLFVPSAIENGAVLVIVERERELDVAVTQIVVPEPDERERDLYRELAKGSSFNPRQHFSSGN